MTQPTFGIVFNQDNTDPRPVSPIDMSVVGLVGTAPGADAAKFPLNVPVMIFSSDSASEPKSRLPKASVCARLVPPFASGGRASELRTETGPSDTRAGQAGQAPRH